jgi:hypothetical protein
MVVFERGSRDYFTKGTICQSKGELERSALPPGCTPVCANQDAAKGGGSDR